MTEENLKRLYSGIGIGLGFGLAGLVALGVHRAREARAHRWLGPAPSPKEPGEMEQPGPGLVANMSAGGTSGLPIEGT